jgi:hypothetical protein
MAEVGSGTDFGFSDVRSRSSQSGLNLRPLITDIFTIAHHRQTVILTPEATTNYDIVAENIGKFKFIFKKALTRRSRSKIKM